MTMIFIATGVAAFVAITIRFTGHEARLVKKAAHR